MLNMFAQFVKGVNLRKGNYTPYLLICPDMVRQTVKILFPEIPSLSKLLNYFKAIWLRLLILSEVIVESGH